MGLPWRDQQKHNLPMGCSGGASNNRGPLQGALFQGAAKSTCNLWKFYVRSVAMQCFLGMTPFFVWHTAMLALLLHLPQLKWKKNTSQKPSQLILGPDVQCTDGWGHEALMVVMVFFLWCLKLNKILNNKSALRYPFFSLAMATVRVLILTHVPSVPELRPLCSAPLLASLRSLWWRKLFISPLLDLNPEGCWRRWTSGKIFETKTWQEQNADWPSYEIFSHVDLLCRSDC